MSIKSQPAFRRDMSLSFSGKCRFTFNGLHEVIFQKTGFFKSRLVSNVEEILLIHKIRETEFGSAFVILSTVAGTNSRILGVPFYTYLGVQFRSSESVERSG